MRDSVEVFIKFSQYLDRVARNRRLMEASIACVHLFVGSARFTQRTLLSGNGIGLFTSAASAVGIIREESSYEH